MAELLLLFAGLILFAAGCVGMAILQNREYKARHDQTVEAEEDKTDQIANLNSEIERASRGR